MSGPTVTVVVPTLDEEASIVACLEAVRAQTYAGIVEVLVVDGGSQDATRRLAATFPEVVILDNPDRRQSAGLNRALAVARGRILVRVDAHCLIEPDYVARCVDALGRTGAAMVGGAQVPAAASGFGAAVAATMRSRLGAGTARFHRPDGSPGWVDTVYLGAYATDTARRAGGYDAGQRTNEDAELAWRMRGLGGVWFDPTIRSTYRPRTTPAALGRQFFRYGRGRVRTAVRHPDSLSARQLAAPALVIGLVSPWRRAVGLAYVGMLVSLLVSSRRLPGSIAARVPLAGAIMHMAWGLGFLAGLPGAVVRRLSPAAGPDGWPPRPLRSGP